MEFIYTYFFNFADVVTSFILALGASNFETVYFYIFDAQGYLVVNTAYNGPIIIENVVFAILGGIYDVPVIGAVIKTFVEIVMGIIGTFNYVMFYPLYMPAGYSINSIPFIFCFLTYILKICIILGVFKFITVLFSTFNE